MDDNSLSSWEWSQYTDWQMPLMSCHDKGNPVSDWLANFGQPTRDRISLDMTWHQRHLSIRVVGHLISWVFQMSVNLYSKVPLYKMRIRATTFQINISSVYTIQKSNSSSSRFGRHLVFFLIGIFLVDADRPPPSPPQKCPFSENDFLDVSDDFKQKKNYFIKFSFGLEKFFRT